MTDLPPPSPHETIAEYRIWQTATNAAADTLVTLANSYSLEREAMLSEHDFVLLDPDLAGYLREEAQRRGVTIEEVYQEEMTAKKELARITPSHAELLRFADRFPAPQIWDYDE